MKKVWKYMYFIYKLQYYGAETATSQENRHTRKEAYMFNQIQGTSPGVDP